MKIVMLEPPGVSEERLNKLAEPFTTQGHEFLYCGGKLSEEEKMKRAEDADVFVIANSPLTAKVINAADNLKMISVGFTGIDHVDVDACRKKNVMICNAQGYATDSTGELAIGLMLACLRNIVPYTEVVKAGGTLAGIPGEKPAAAFTHNTLKGKTVGIVGTGQIGRKVAALAKAFGCRVLASAPHIKQEALDLGVEYTDIDTLFRESDIVSLHAPLMESTRNIADRERIFSMKKTGILINCSRGALVDSQALADALNEGRIAGAGIDVFENEPPIDKDHPLLNAKNVILTPHVGFDSEESLEERAVIVMDNISAWLAGKPVNVK